MCRRLLLASLLPLLGACNMAISEAPMFAESDRATTLPRDGLWLSSDKDCRFDSRRPEAAWPDCALWVVVRSAGANILLTDGKGQSESIGGLIAAGDPMIMQGRWVDTAKEPQRAYFGFYGIEPQQVGPDGRFSAATVWPVECGIQKSPGTEIVPFQGIGPDCRPMSKEAIRSAAAQSQRADQISEWRWLRLEAPTMEN